ncbi:MAG: hypothetical protein AAGD12_08420 [Pseudomonadota bacterium]
MLHRSPGLLLILTALVGCGVTQAIPNLEEIYGQAAELQGPERLPLIGLPGTLGSRLVDVETGTEVWGRSDGLSVIPTDPADYRLIALPVGDGTTPNRDLRDSVRPAGVLQRAYPEVLGVPVEVEVYAKLRETVQLGGWITHEDPLIVAQADQSAAAPIPPIDANSFPFAYDWRRDLVTLVRDLDAHVRQKSEQVALRAATTFDHDGPVQFNLLAHSMGTLITRYYLMYGTQDLPEDGSLPELTWEGARHFNSVILIAPPNAGSITALENLVNGKSLGPLQPYYSAALIGTHFSTYALMPRNRHQRVLWSDTQEPVADIYDPELWLRMGWGLADPEAAEELAVWMPDVADPEERRRRAIGFQAEALMRARQLHAALDRPVEALPPGLDLYLVIGGSHPTPATAEIDRESGEVFITGYEEGDGVVLRASSLLDERQGTAYRIGLRTPLKWSSVLFLPEEHVELTQSAVFGDNLLFWLLQGQRTYDQPDTLPDGPLQALPLLTSGVETQQFRSEDADR